jgi:hypothetical protein
MIRNKIEEKVDASLLQSLSKMSEFPVTSDGGVRDVLTHRER